MRDFGREERVGAEIHRELALLLRNEVRDPRLNQVTIQEVRVVRDMSHARVFFTLMDRDQAKDVEQALKKAASFLRRRLSDLMNLRSMPQLHFEYDASLETGARLESLINKAIASDNKDEND